LLSPKFRRKRRAWATSHLVRPAGLYGKRRCRNLCNQIAENQKFKLKIFMQQDSFLKPGLDLLTLATQLDQHLKYTFLGDGLDSASRDQELYPALLLNHPEALEVQIGLEAAASMAMRVTNRIAVNDSLTRDDAAAAGDRYFFSTGHLFCLPEQHMLAAEAAKLLELKPIRCVPLILGGGVAHLFAVSALK
jgi:hypothetical protein